ncbi:MAG: ATP-dependent zinc protease [Thiotrichales bacterium]|nr:ATP-dependent zinc protease [Thiotrichales bacterium]
MFLTLHLFLKIIFYYLISSFMVFAQAQYKVSGWLEPIKIAELNDLALIAKVDTGADYSSIHAQDIKLFEQNGQLWVHFQLLGQHAQVKKVLKMVRIKPKSPTDAASARPVVLLNICFGEQKQQVAFNLTNRAHLKHLVLIGRSDIPLNWLVDPHQIELTKPRCTTD